MEDHPYWNLGSSNSLKVPAKLSATTSRRIQLLRIRRQKALKMAIATAEYANQLVVSLGGKLIPPTTSRCPAKYAIPTARGSTTFCARLIPRKNTKLETTPATI